jgi:hypothetical protein
MTIYWSTWELIQTRRCTAIELPPDTNLNIKASNTNKSRRCRHLLSLSLARLRKPKEKWTRRKHEASKSKHKPSNVLHHLSFIIYLVCVDTIITYQHHCTITLMNHCKSNWVQQALPSSRHAGAPACALLLRLLPLMRYQSLVSASSRCLKGINRLSPSTISSILPFGPNLLG